MSRWLLRNRWLFPGWKAILCRAWSVWATGLTIIFAAGEVALPLLHDSVADALKGWCAVAAGVCAAGSIALRLIPQRGLSLAQVSEAKE